MKIPADRKYSSDHQWVMISEKIGRVGLTDYAQDALGEVVFVQLPIIGDVVQAGATCSEVESTKSVSDVYTPVAGRIRQVNSSLDNSPGLINSDPYNEGWIFELEVEDPASVSQLMDSSAYKQLIEG